MEAEESGKGSRKGQQKTEREKVSGRRCRGQHVLRQGLESSASPGMSSTSGAEHRWQADGRGPFSEGSKRQARGTVTATVLSAWRERRQRTEGAGVLVFRLVRKVRLEAIWSLLEGNQWTKSPQRQKQGRESPSSHSKGDTSSNNPKRT